MDDEKEISEDEYKRFRKSQPRRIRRAREDPGDPSVIGGFKGPWCRCVGIHQENDPRQLKEEISLRKIVNKHCLTIGKELSRRNYFTSMDDMSRIGSKRFVIPRRHTLLFHDHKDMISSVQLFRHARLALSSSFDGKVLLYNLKNNDLLTTYMGHSKAVSSTRLNSDEARFNTTSFDGFLKRWNVETGRCEMRLDCSSPLTCQSSEVSNEVVVGGLDGIIRIMDLRSKVVSKIGDSCDSKDDLFNPPAIIDISRRDNLIIFSRRDGSLHFIDMRNESIIKSYDGSYSFISSNNRTLMVVDDDDIRFFDTSQFNQDERRINASGCSTRIIGSDECLIYGDIHGMINVINTESMETRSIGSTSEMITSIDWIEGISSNFISGDILGNVAIWE